MAKKKEQKEFDFDKAYQNILEQANASGLSEDMVFQTLLKEFKRMKNVCDELYAGIESEGVCFKEIGSMGQKTFKSNPLNKEYVSAHKTLVSTSIELAKMIANVGSSDNNDTY